MALQTMRPTDEILSAFKRGAQTFAGRQDPAVQRLSDANVLSLRTFVLNLSDIPQRQPQGARTTGWRIIAGAPGRTLMAGDLAERNDGLRLVSFSRDDPQLATLYEQLKAVDDLDAVRSQEKFEVKLLRIPAILVDAFWLTSEASGKEFIVPIRVPDNELELMRQYTVNEFFDKIEPLARKFQGFDRVGRDFRTER